MLETVHMELGHTEALQLFAAYVDSELAAPESARLESHLAGCEPCRASWRKYERAVTAVRRLPRRRAPLGFASAVLARARRERRFVRSTRAGIVLFYKLQIPHVALTVVLLAGCAAEVVALMLTS